MQGAPLGVSLGVSKAALQDVHLALQRLVLLGCGARIQLQDEGRVLFGQHISFVLCLSLPPGSAPALSGTLSAMASHVLLLTKPSPATAV